MPDLKFLLDADMPISSAKVIRSLGYDVVDVRDIGMRAATDQEIIHYALKNKRIIVTKDTDFGEIIRHPSHPGAIIFRLSYTYTSKELNKTLADFLNSVDDSKLANAIINVELGRYRRRGLLKSDD